MENGLARSRRSIHVRSSSMEDELKHNDDLMFDGRHSVTQFMPSQPSPTQLVGNNPGVETKRKIIKDVFCETFEASTLHALPNAIRNEFIFMKIFWTILFFAGCGVSIYYVYATLAQYLEYGTVASVSKYLATVQTFPAVTICNVAALDFSNPNTSSYAKAILTIEHLNSTIVPNSNEYSIYLVRKYMSIIKSNSLSNVNGGSSTYIKNLGFTIDSMLISCYFNGDACSSADFYFYYSYEYGNCYIFNYDDGNTTLKTVSQSGPTSGLQLELYAGEADKGDGYVEQSGFYISVNNNSQLPLTKYEGIFVPTGLASKIAVDTTYYYKLDAPYSDCRMDTSTYYDSDSTYYKNTINITKYTQKLCFEICMQYEFIIPTCGCSDPSIPSVSSTEKICKTWTDITCVSNVTSEFNSVDLSTTCAQYCPLECNSQEFNYLISAANYPTLPYFNIVSKQSNVAKKFSSGANISQSDFTDACALVNVFLSDLYYTEIDESADITVEGVFGNIGGQMGLYIGASFLSFFEIVEFIVNTLFRLRRNQVNARTLHDSSAPKR